MAPTEPAAGVGDFLARVVPRSLAQNVIGAVEFVPRTAGMLSEGVAKGLDIATSRRGSIAEGWKAAMDPVAETAQGLTEFVGKPFGLYGADAAKEVWLSDPIAPVMVLAPGIPKSLRIVKDSTPYRRLTIKERGLFDAGVAQDIQSGAITPEQIRQLWKDPANRESLINKYARGTEPVTTKESGAPVRASGTESPAQLAMREGHSEPYPADGATLSNRIRADVVTNKTRQIEGPAAVSEPLALPSGQGFELQTGTPYLPAKSTAIRLPHEPVGENGGRILLKPEDFTPAKKPAETPARVLLSPEDFAEPAPAAIAAQKQTTNLSATPEIVEPGANKSAVVSPVKTSASVNRRADFGVDEAMTGTPVYQAIENIKSNGGLNLGSLKADYGKEQILELARKRPGLVSRKGAAKLDEIAQEHGFADGDTLLQEILGAKSKKQVAQDVKDSYMEVHGEGYELAKKGFVETDKPKTTAIDLNPGEKVKLKGKTDIFVVKGGKGSGVILKDGETLKYNAFDPVPVTHIKKLKKNQAEIPGASFTETFDLAPAPGTLGDKPKPHLKNPTAKLFDQRGSMPLSPESEVVRAILAAKGKIKEALPHLESLGRRLYESGKTKFTDWYKGMEKAIGPTWRSFTRHAKGIFAQIAKPLRNQRGSVRPGASRVIGKEEAREYLSGQPIASISGMEFSKTARPLTDVVSEWYAENYKGKATNPAIGDVILDRRGIKDSIGHGLGRIKSAAFALVPDIIEKGKIISHADDWQGRKIEGSVIAAPVRIGKDHHIGVVVVRKSKETQRFYLHEVYLTQKLQEPFKTGAFPLQEGRVAGGPGVITNLLHEIFNVKTINRLAKPLQNQKGKVGLDINREKPGSDTWRVGKDIYETNRAMMRKSLLRIAKKDAKDILGDIREMADEYLGSISTRLGNINPELKTHLRRFEMKRGLQISMRTKRVMPMFEKVKKMTPDDRIDFDLARKNGDASKLKQILDKYKMWNEYTNGTRKPKIRDCFSIERI